MRPALVVGLSLLLLASTAKAENAAPAPTASQRLDRPPPALVHRSPTLMYVGLGLTTCGIGAASIGALAGSDEAVLAGVGSLAIGVPVMLYGEQKVPPVTVALGPRTAEVSITF